MSKLLALTGGIASVCSDCTAYTMQGKPGVSLEARGRESTYGMRMRKWLWGDTFENAGEIEEALGKIPGTFE